MWHVFGHQTGWNFKEVPLHIWNCVVWSRSRNFYRRGWKATTCRRSVAVWHETLQFHGYCLRFEHPSSCRGYPNPRPCRIHPGHTPQSSSRIWSLKGDGDRSGPQMLILEERRRATEERLGPKVWTSKRRFRTREQGIWDGLRWFELVWAWHISRFRWILFTFLPCFFMVFFYQLPVSTFHHSGARRRPITRNHAPNSVAVPRECGDLRLTSKGLLCTCTCTYIYIYIHT